MAQGLPLILVKETSRSYIGHVFDVPIVYCMQDELPLRVVLKILKLLAFGLEGHI